MASFIQNVPAQLPVDPQQTDMGEVLRQRRLAEQLAASSQQALPPGQMVGNRFVPTAWTQSLANAVGEGLSGYLNRKADTREKELVAERNAKRLAAFKASAGLPDESVLEEGGAAQSPYAGAFNGSAKYDAANPADYSTASLNPLRNASTVGVAGRSLPELTDRQKLIKRIADTAAATDQDPYALMQMDPLIQSDLRIAELMRTPQKFAAGEIFAVPGQKPIVTNPKETAPRALKTEKVLKRDANGAIVYDKNGDAIMEVRTFDPATGALGDKPLGEDIANTGTKVTQSVGFPKPTFDQEEKLREKHTAASQTFVKLRDAYNTIKATLAGPITAPATLAAATKFMKMLDPESVVRESELQMALKSQGLLDRFMNLANVVQKGQVLTSTQAAEIQRIADVLYTTSEKQQTLLDDQYKGLAKEYGLDGNRVVLRQRAVTADDGEFKVKR